jgi:hypothetical protein
MSAGKLTAHPPWKCGNVFKRFFVTTPRPGARRMFPQCRSRSPRLTAHLEAFEPRARPVGGSVRPACKTTSGLPIVRNEQRARDCATFNWITRLSSRSGGRTRHALGLTQEQKEFLGPWRCGRFSECARRPFRFRSVPSQVRPLTDDAGQQVTLEMTSERDTRAGSGSTGTR